MVEMGVDHVEQVLGFLVGNGDFRRVAAVLPVGGADQGKALQVRYAEDNALVFVLQDIGVFAFIQARHDQVAALDQANTIGRIELEVVLDETGHPRAGSIDQGACPNALLLAVGMQQVYLPQAIYTLGAQAAGAGQNVSTVFTGGHGIEHRQAGIVDCTVGVLETTGDLRFERVARAKAQAARGAQALALAQVVIQEQASANHPGRAQVRAVWQHETHGLDDVWRLGQQHFTFSQRFAYQAKLVVLKVAQAAVDQFAAGR